MTGIDLRGLTLASGPKITLAQGIVGESGAGTDYTGWADVGSVYLAAKCDLRFGSRGSARIVLTVEESDDGNSWTSLTTFTFGAGGSGLEQTATVTPTKDHLRVSWATTGNGEWQILYVHAAPGIVDSPGGGGGGDFNGGTITDPLFANVDDDANAAVKVKNAGDGNAFQVDSHSNAGVLQVFHYGSIFSRPEAGGVPLFIQPRSTEVPAIQVRGMTAAPPDGSLQATDVTFWLDATPGSAKFMVKAKDSGGTAVSGRVPLGGGDAPVLIGPYTVNFDDDGIQDDGSLIVALDAGTIVLSVHVLILTPWDGGAQSLIIALGGEDYGPPDDDYVTIYRVVPDTTQGGNGMQIFGPNIVPESAGSASVFSGGGVLTTSGALVAYESSGDPTQGQAHVYALVKLP